MKGMKSTTKPEGIRLVAFDYGGTLDLPGLHWFDFLWNLVQTKLPSSFPVTRDEFWDAYVYGERELEKHPVPSHSLLYDTLLQKCTYEADYLVQNKLLKDYKPSALLASCAAETIKRDYYPESRKVLATLSASYQLCVVSNYYGNLEATLGEAGFLQYLTRWFDSTLVGIRKPDPGLWQTAIDACGLLQQQILVVGDSMKNDILPARSLGCPTVWLSPEPDSGYEGLRISRISELPGLL